MRFELFIDLHPPVCRFQPAAFVLASGQPSAQKNKNGGGLLIMKIMKNGFW
ncbi:MAG: hypothetical protein HY394_03840 [Candidatus Diapherotrites archaeon]|nr:hypothetical protein [Candidatus Diapherotrites archaeon]